MLRRTSSLDSLRDERSARNFVGVKIYINNVSELEFGKLRKRANAPLDGGIGVIY